MLNKAMEDFIVYRLDRVDDEHTRKFLKRFFEANPTINEPWEMIFSTLPMNPDYEGSGDLQQSAKDFEAGWRAAEEFYDNYPRD